MTDQTILPVNTVIGRIGLTPGPAEALPFSTIQSQLNTIYLNQVNDGAIAGAANISVAAGPWHLLTITGPTAINFTGWPVAPLYAEVELELVNGGTNVTWPTIHWLKGDGTNSTTFSSMGVVLNASGTNWIIVWSRDGGVTIWGKAA